MNDTIAAAVFAEHRRREGQRNRSGWQQPSNRRASVRHDLAELLLALAARLSPAPRATTTPAPAPLA